MLVGTEKPDEKLGLLVIRPMLCTWVIDGPSQQVLTGPTATDVILRVTVSVLTPTSPLARLVIPRHSIGLLAFACASGG